MKLKQSEVRQVVKALKMLERRYENAGKAVNADDMKAVRTVLPKFEELQK